LSIFFWPLFAPLIIVILGQNTALNQVVLVIAAVWLGISWISGKTRPAMAVSSRTRINPWRRDEGGGVSIGAIFGFFIIGCFSWLKTV